MFAKFCQKSWNEAMSTMNISLPDSLKSFVDEQVTQRGYPKSELEPKPALHDHT
jgi:antitoxin ParD1/3/4